jgi:N-acetylglucosamine kinase-like BadF-type ATPase
MFLSPANWRSPAKATTSSPIPTWADCSWAARRWGPLIVRFADEGDPLARPLLAAAASEIERLIRLAGRERALPVALIGGLVPSLEPRLPASVRSALTAPLADPIEGALLRARGLVPPEAYAAHPL